MMNKFFFGEAKPHSVRDPISEMLNNPAALSSFMSSKMNQGQVTHSANNWGNRTGAFWNPAAKFDANTGQWSGAFQFGGGGGYGGYGIGGGGGAGAPSSGAPQYGGIQAETFSPIAGQSGSAQGLGAIAGQGGLAPQAIGTLPVASGSSTGLAALSGGAGAATAAPAAAISGSGGFWGNAAKWAMSNQRLLTGVVSAAGSLYGSYQDKKAQEKAYNWQKEELAARRAYEQQRIDAARNSPIARMTAPLMKTVLELYSKKLAKRGVNLDLASMLGMIPQ